MRKSLSFAYVPVKTYGNTCLRTMSGEAVIFLGALEEFPQEASYRLAQSFFFPPFQKNIKGMLVRKTWNGEQTKTLYE